MPRFLLLFLALVALFNLSRVLREPLPGPDRPMDFRTCYVGQAVLHQGQNPYADDALKAGWQRITRQEHLISRTQPGLPNLPFLYPPWAAALFGLTVGWLAYAVAWPLWYVLALLSLGLLARLWAVVIFAENTPSVPWWQFLLAAVALKGTVPALLTGQPTFVALALGVGALAVGSWAESAKKCSAPRAESAPATPIRNTVVLAVEAAVESFTTVKNRDDITPNPSKIRLNLQMVAGLLLGLAAFKVTLLLPFAAWFLWKKQWLTLATAAAVVVLLSVLAWHWAAFPASLLPTYQHLLAQVRAQSFNPTDPDYPLTQGMTLRLELANVLEWLRPGSGTWHVPLHAALWLGTGLRLVHWRRQGQQMANWYIFLILSILTLLTTYHLYYDAVLLLPLLAFGRRLPLRRQWLLLALLLPLLLPLNGIALALGNPVAWHFVYFMMPVALLGVLVLLLMEPVEV